MHKIKVEIIGTNKARGLGGLRPKPSYPENVLLYDIDAQHIYREKIQAWNKYTGKEYDTVCSKSDCVCEYGGRQPCQMIGTQHTAEVIDEHKCRLI